jgi:triacylglycerol lipase
VVSSVVGGKAIAIPVLLLAVACADDTTAADGGGGAGVLTGAGGAASTADAGSMTDAGATADASAATGWATASSATGGGEGGAAARPHPIVLAHGFFGFEEFAGLDFATYFYQVKEELAAQGEIVHTPAVDPFNDSTFRGAQLAEHVDAILAATGAEKVILVGHSQGGLDARVVAHDHPEKVAAVITVATPHGGSPVADVLLGLVEDDRAADLLDELAEWVGGALYDEAGEETSIAAPLRLFSQPGIQAFNEAYPDAPGVFYASITGRSGGAGAGGDCTPDVALPWVAQWVDQRDPIDPLFAVAEVIVAGGFDDVVNDGLVRARDARHGEFWGCVPADHLDEVGHLFGDGPGGGNTFRHQVFWRELVHEIRARGL